MSAVLKATDKGACPNLLAETGLYRYAEGESPIDEHDHALDALRYRIARIDAHSMARTDRPSAPAPAPHVKKVDERMWADAEDSGGFRAPIG